MTLEKKITSRNFRRNDFASWLPLWEANNEYQITRKKTDESWKKITTKNIPLFGLGLWEGDDLIGLLHYALHPITGQENEACFMQDIYIVPDKRGRGLAKELLQVLFDIAQAKEWAWVYWFALNDNLNAQALYKKVGVKMDMSVHMIMPSLAL